MKTLSLVSLTLGACLLCAAVPCGADDAGGRRRDCAAERAGANDHRQEGQPAAHRHRLRDRAGERRGAYQPDGAGGRDRREVYVRVGQSVAKDDRLIELAPTPPDQRRLRGRGVGRACRRRCLGAYARSCAPNRSRPNRKLAAAEKADSDARAALAAWRAQGAGGPTIVRAPAAAVVTVVTTSTGAIVAEGAPLIELAAPKGLVLAAGVVPSQAATIKVGDAGRGYAGRRRKIVGGEGLAAWRLPSIPASGLVPDRHCAAAGGLVAGRVGAGGDHGRRRYRATSCRTRRYWSTTAAPLRRAGPAGQGQDRPGARAAGGRRRGCRRRGARYGRAADPRRRLSAARRHERAPTNAAAKPAK